MGTIIAANSDYLYGDICTSNMNSNTFHSTIMLQGTNTNAMQAIDNTHMDAVYDTFMQNMGRTTYSSVEAQQELADVLRGILDGQQQAKLIPLNTKDYAECVSPHSNNSYDTDAQITHNRYDNDTHAHNSYDYAQCVSPHSNSSYDKFAHTHNSFDIDAQTLSSYVDDDAHTHTSSFILDDDAHTPCVQSPHEHQAGCLYLQSTFSPLAGLHAELHYDDQQDNPIPSLSSTTCEDHAFLPNFSLLKYDNHHFDATNPSSAPCSKQDLGFLNHDNHHLEAADHSKISSATCISKPDLSFLNFANQHLDNANHISSTSSATTCSKPMYHDILDEFTLCGIKSGGLAATYGISSSSRQGVVSGAGVDDHGALKIEAEICSENHVACDDGFEVEFDHNFTKEFTDHDDNVCKEHVMLCPQPYQMVCDHDCLYPSGMNIMQREAVYAAAAFQPVDWAGILAKSSGTRPKRRNVRISDDPQTASARRRRERISDRIRVLQRMVPGGMKMDTASMLDEAIHYLKFLKSQVQTLEWLETRSSTLSSSPSSCFYPNFTTNSLPNRTLIK